MNNEEYLSCKELAKLLKLNRQVVQTWAREKKIPSLTFGSDKKRPLYRFNKAEILEFFKNSPDKKI
jgi:excisionase family DNA binding protein